MTQLAPDETTATRKDDVVVLVVPADGSYLAVLRAATAASSDLTCEFEVTPAALTIEVAVPVQGTAALPGNQSFSWQVLTALAGEVAADTTPGRAAIRLTKRRTQS